MGTKFGQVNKLEEGLATRLLEGTLFGGEAPEKHLGFSGASSVPPSWGQWKKKQDLGSVLAP